MSIPFGDSPSILFHRIASHNKKPTSKQLKLLPPTPREADNTKLYQSISTATTISSAKSIDSNTISSSSSSSSSSNSSSTSNNLIKNEKGLPSSPPYDDSDKNITTRSSNYDLSYYFHSSNNNTTITEEEAETEETNKRSSDLLYRARSLSIGSTISSHFISNAATSTAAAFNEYHDNKDETPHTDTTMSCKFQQQMYKNKTDKSNKKAYQFFGEQIKLEISAKEIRREGLKALLFSTVPLGYFLYHLLNEYSSENLFFFLAVENYQNYNFSSDIERQQVANKISKAYLTRNSDLEVNLEDRIYRAVKKSLLEQQKQPSISTGNEFDAAKRHVFSLLNVSYHRFRTSSIWNIMESKCSDLNTYDRERSQALVVNLLLSYLKRNISSSLFKLVHSFCKIYLPLGYEFRLSSPNKQEFLIKENSSSTTTNRRNRSKSLGGSDKKCSSNFISSRFDNIFFKNLNKSTR